MSKFLDDDDLAKLTGRKGKSMQREQLRIMGVAFFTNASGHPVVAWSAVEGRAEVAQTVQPWIPAPLRPNGTTTLNK